MQQKFIPFDRLPFSRLFQTYTGDYSALQDFFEGDPFDPDVVERRAGSIPEPASRARLAELLRSFNEPFDPPAAVKRNIDRLEEEGALAVVTGQQLSLYGGPLYTVFKTLTAIHRAETLQERLDRPVIPVFWLADEDHDYDEVRHCTLLEGNETRRIELPPDRGDQSPVADRKIPPEIDRAEKRMRELLLETDFTGELRELLEECYRPGNTFAQAFGRMLLSLFGERGLVLFGSNSPDVKEACAEVMAEAIEQADAVREALETRSRLLEESWHSQVTLYDSNLFLLSETGDRIKISRNGTNWKAGGQEWSGPELVSAIREHPARFSPNVFLRPVIQDRLLPTLGYVAGPGEVAYYAQMKSMYRCFDMRMPLIFPRLSATLIEPAIDRIFNELPFEIPEYSRRIEDLESEYVNRTEQADIEGIFDTWKREVEQLSERHREQVGRIDPTLEGAAGKATAAYFGELDKLKGKVYRAVKQQEQTQLHRIHRIKSQLFPDGGMQERTVAAAWFMNKYGTALWERLLDSLDDGEHFNTHKLIYL